MKRVLNASRYLKGVIDPGTEYYVGFGTKELTKLGQTHPDVQALINETKSSVILTGKKGPLKENTSGKFVRKKPESKESIWRHIEYYSNQHGKFISYDRLFYIWEKELLHKFNLELTARRTPQGEMILVFPRLKMEDSEQHYLKAGAAMNLACALSNYHLMYNTSLEPIIPVTKVEDKSLLPAGISDRPVTVKLEEIEKRLFSFGPPDSTGNSYRFAILKDHDPTDVTMGNGGFNEYLKFEFPKEDLIVFEDLKNGNATYIFKRSTFDPKADLDKQNAKGNIAFLGRVVHENINGWSTHIGRYFGDTGESSKYVSA